MADAPVVQIGDTSPEKVAFNLMLNVAVAEGKTFRNVGGFPFVTSETDRKWLLDTYAECLRTVQDPVGRMRGLHARDERENRA